MATEEQAQSTASQAAESAAADEAKTADQVKDQPASDAAKAKDAPETKDDAQDAKDDLAKQVAALTQQVNEKEDQYLRAQAEIQNMTKRFAKERESLAKYDGQELAKAILPVLDNLKRALAIEVTDDNGQQLKKGIQMVHDHLEAALKDHGVVEVDALNKPFDPQTSQAVQTVAVEAGQQPDTVVNVLQAGYLLHDRVLRPAMVVVAQ